MVPFSISKYKDEVCCDVISIHVSYLILRGSWQFVKQLQHKGRTNCYSLQKDDLNYVLTPLTLREVHEDQIKLTRTFDIYSEKEKEKERPKIRRRLTEIKRG